MLNRGRKSAQAAETLAIVTGDEPRPRTSRIDRSQPAPDHLSDEMRSWWVEITSRYDLESHHLKLLEAACSALDRMTEARKAVQAEGMSYLDEKGVRRPNPCVAIERDARIGFARLVRELGLDTEVKDQYNRSGFWPGY